MQKMLEWDGEIPAILEIVNGTAVRSDSNGKVEDSDNARYLSWQAFKVYQRGLDDVKCSKTGDAMFFATERSWTRLY